MDEIFTAVLNRMDTVTGLQTVDIDWGQLDEQNDSYPMSFPGVLVDVPEIPWNETGTPFQQGQATIRVKIAIDIPEDSGKDAGTRADAMARLTIIKEVNKKLHRWNPGESIGKLKRVSTRCYNLLGVKVFEVDYTAEVAEVAV